MMPFETSAAAFRRAFLIFALAAPVFAQAQVCADFSEQRLESLMVHVALVAEQVDTRFYGRTEALARQTASLRDLTASRDEAALQAACRMLTQYPSLESVLAEASLTLDDPEIQRWFAEQRSSPGEGNNTAGCLSVSAYNGLRTVLLALRLLDVAVQAVCDSMACFSGTCRICSIAAAVSGVVLPTFDAALAGDSLNCETAHTDEMTDHCEDVNGACSNGRGSVNSFFELEELISDSLVVSLRELSVDVATEATLVQTRGLIDDRLDRTLDQISTVRQGVADDAERRARFQADLRVLEIEAALSGALAATPIQLQLPRVFGGRLEEVREVVADAIVTSDEAGIAIGDALTFLVEGDAFFNSGKYGPAFSSYRQAYGELVQ